MADNHGGKTDYAKAMQSKTIREFDEHITIGCFGERPAALVCRKAASEGSGSALTTRLRPAGWNSVDEYYAGSSSSLSIPHVQIPLLCIQAENDPIAPANAIPYEEIKANPNCILVTTPTGGKCALCIFRRPRPVSFSSRRLTSRAAVISRTCCLALPGHLGWTSGPSGIVGEPWTDRGENNAGGRGRAGVQRQAAFEAWLTGLPVARRGD